MERFNWTEKSTAAALALAEGKTRQRAADEIGVSRRTLQRWLACPDFAAEVDRLSQMVSTANRAERLRIAMRAVRQKISDDGKVETDKDLLDWLKFAQSETRDVKLDLAILAETYDLAP